MKVSFETNRLSVLNWRSFKQDICQLSASVGIVTTKNVMKSLPPNWQSLDSEEKINTWITDREEESICLSVCSKKLETMIGIVLLDRPEENAKNIEFRLGYLIAEEFWGQGYATEIVRGLCNFCDVSNRVISVVGGVDPSNIGSIKVLTKNGFVLDSIEPGQNTQFYKYTTKK